MQFVFPSLDMLDCEGRHEVSCTRGSNSQSSRHIVGPAFQIQPTVQVLFSVVILGLHASMLSHVLHYPANNR